ncbi:hypothetical protein PO124_17385 [Bacillus licheniformis]|nr:hypothetical protein [Bacillus licheniformis]
MKGAYEGERTNQRVYSKKKQFLKESKWEKRHQEKIGRDGNIISEKFARNEREW